MKFDVTEISSLIKEEVKRYKTQVDVAQVGSVLEVGDGIAQVYGLDNAMAGEMLEFEGGVVWMRIRSGRSSMVTTPKSKKVLRFAEPEKCFLCRWVRDCSVAWSMGCVSQSMAKAPFKAILAVLLNTRRRVSRTANRSKNPSLRASRALTQWSRLAVASAN
jgi:hypothetical protein